jgi:hypothetical protein
VDGIAEFGLDIVKLYKDGNQTHSNNKSDTFQHNHPASPQSPDLIGYLDEEAWKSQIV